MTKVQEGLLKLLLEIDTLCRENEIEYCLGGGCLMGAIRNKGFLPWDDDADIHMTRENAEKFYSIINQMPKNRTVYSIKDYPDFLFPCVYRYVDLESTVQATRQILLNHPTGQFIDIIILDDAPTDKEEQNEQADALGYYLELHTENGTISSRRDGAFFDEYFRLKEEIEEKGKDVVLNRLKEKIFNPAYGEGGYYLVGTGIAPNPFLPRKFFYSFRYEEFEGYSLPVPERSEELLRYAYGSTWMYAPPVSEENIHTFLLDPDIPYTIIDEDQKRFIDSDVYWNICCKDKEAWFRTQKERIFVNKEIREVRGVLQRKLTYERINAAGKSLEEISKSNPGKLYSIFKPYYAYQFSETTRFWDILEPLDDDSLYYAMFAMVEAADYSKCSKLINLRREKVVKKLPARMEDLEKRCDIIQECMDLYYVEKNIDKAETRINEGLEVYEDDINLLRLKIKIMYFRGEEEKDFTDFYKELDRVMEIHPNEGEFIFYKASIKEKENELFDALKLYRSAYKSTRNGFVLGESARRIAFISDYLKSFKPEIEEYVKGKLGEEAQNEWYSNVNQSLDSYYIERDYEKCRTEVELGLKKYPDDVNFKRLHLRLVARAAKENGEYDELDNLINAYIRQCPDDGSIAVYQGLRLMREGAYLSARLAFKRVLGHTDNIFDLHTAKTYIERIESAIENSRPTDDYFMRLFTTKKRELKDEPNIDNAIGTNEEILDDVEYNKQNGILNNLSSQQEPDLISNSVMVDTKWDPAGDEAGKMVQDEENPLKDEIEQGILEDIEDGAFESKKINLIYRDRENEINRAIDLFYYDMNYDLCSKVVESSLLKYPDDIFLLRLRVKLLELGPQEEGHNEKLYSEVERILQIYPRDGEFIAYKGDEAAREGKAIKALRFYKDAYKKTKNYVVRGRLRSRINNIEKELRNFRPDIDRTYVTKLGNEESEKWEETVKNCYRLYYGERNFDELKLQLDDALKIYGADSNLRRLHLRLTAREAEKTKDYDFFDAEIEEMMEEYPEKGDVIVYDGLRLLRNRKLLRAQKAFKKVSYTTDNIYDRDTAESKFEYIGKVILKWGGDEEEPEEAELILTEFRELYLADAPMEDCLHLIENSINKYPDSKCLERLRLQYLMEEDASEFIDRVSEAKLKFADDIGMNMFLGDITYYSGHYEKSVDILNSALQYADTPKQRVAINRKIARATTMLPSVMQSGNNETIRSAHKNIAAKGKTESVAKRKYIYRTLLEEIDEICGESGINYYLIDDALKLTLRGRHIENNLREVAIIMLKSEFDKFKRAFSRKGNPNRVIEGLENNPNMPGYFYRYVAINTLFLNLSHLNAFKNFGFCVNIYIPVEEAGSEEISRKIKMYEAEMRSAVLNPYYGEKERHVISRSNSDKRFGKRVFAMKIGGFVKKYSLVDVNKPSHIVFLSGKRCIFPAGTFLPPVELDSPIGNFLSFQDYNSYLEERYGYKGPEAIRRKVSRIGYDFYAHTGVSGNDFLRTLKREHLLSPEFFDHRQQHKALLREYKKYDGPKKKYIEIWRRNGERFKLWKYYMPMKDEILGLYGEGKYEELEQVLKRYIYDMKYYRMKKLGICFDYEILNIAIDVIANSDKLDVAEWELRQMMDYVPDEHLHEDIGQFIEKYAPEGYRYKLQPVMWNDL